MSRKSSAQSFPKPAPARKSRDPYLYALIWQTVLCLLILVCGFALREGRPALWEMMKPGYDQLLLSQTQAGGFRRMAEDTVAALQDAAGDAARRVKSVYKSVYMTPDQAAQPNETDVEAGMAGMGGGGTPEGCTLSPVLLSAMVEPPIGGRVTSGYGWRTHPITENDDFHRGMDIAAASGSPIHAVLPGVVAETGESAIYGNYICLDHGHGLQTAYSHCETIVAQEGEILKKGELLGTVGSTGVSTGPHVHFEILMNGTYYDPAWVMEVRYDGD